LPVRQEKTRQQRLPRSKKHLLLAEGHAVGALVHGGIGLVGTHQNPLQRAVVLLAAVMGTGLHSALDALVCMTVHIPFLLPGLLALVWPPEGKRFIKNFPILLFSASCDIVAEKSDKNLWSL
jgi:hypothetical protein